MKIFKKAAVCVLSVLMALGLLASCSAKPAEKEKDKIYTGSYEEIVNAFYEDHKDEAAGAMVGVFDKNGTLFEGYYGYSNIAEGIKVDENTVIDWGSTTKTMVWVSVMQLWEQGKIDLEADIRTYLPEGFLTNLRYDKPVRMIDLMNHRAGFQEYYTDMMIDTQFEYHSLEEALKLDMPPQIFEPDTVTAYSNWGVALASYIVERVSGQSFADYVHEHIFKPLEMNDTAITPDLMDNPDVRARRDKLVCYSGTTPTGTTFYYISVYPAGACVSTLKDFIKWASCFVQDEFPLFEDPNTFDIMMTATSYFGETQYVRNCHGIWGLPYGANTYGHGGNTQGCSSYITFDPEKQIGCVVMTNQSSEKNFNGKLFKSIYGEPVYEYSAGEPKKGLYHPSRTVLEGHYKIMGASYMTEDSFEDWSWTYNEKDGIPKFENTYGDFYLASTGTAIFEIALLYGWFISLGFAALSLIVKGIRAIVLKIRKSKKKILLGKETGLMSLVELLIGLAGGIFFVLMTAWMRHETYAWVPVAMIILALALIALIIISVVKLFKASKKDSSVIRKIYNVAAILFAVLTVIVIIYMELWH